MIPKQDRVYPRKPSDLEQKYDLGSTGKDSANSLKISQLEQSLVLLASATENQLQNMQKSIDAYKLETDAKMEGLKYTLPVATEDNLGGVMIGDGVNVDKTGKISVTQRDWVHYQYDVGETGAISLPECAELRVTIGVPGDMYTFRLLADELSEDAETFRNGYYTSETEYGDAYITVSNTQIDAWAVRKEGVVQSDAVAKIYYR